MTDELETKNVEENVAVEAVKDDVQVIKNVNKFTTIKAKRETGQKLKLIAAERKKKMYEILEEVINSLQ